MEQPWWEDMATGGEAVVVGEGSWLITFYRLSRNGEQKVGAGYEMSTCIQQHTLLSMVSAPKSVMVFPNSTTSRDQIFQHRC